MSDKYSIEQIVKATLDLTDGPHCGDVDDYIELLKAELQKPAFTPAIGQVYKCVGNSARRYYFGGGSRRALTGAEKPLTLTEHGPVVRRLLEHMQRLTSTTPISKGPSNLAREDCARLDFASESVRRAIEGGLVDE